MPRSTRALVVALVLLTLAPEAAAQTPDSLDAYEALDAEVRDLPLSGSLYYQQLGEAWDRAVVAGRYGRADSVAVLAETYAVETTGSRAIPSCGRARATASRWGSFAAIPMCWAG